MSTGLIRCIGIISCVSLVACAPSPEPEEAALTSDQLAATQPAPITQQDIEAQTDAFTAAVRARDTTALGDVYAPDAVFVSARGKLEGSDAIMAFWKDAASRGAGGSLEAQTLKFGTSGDIAWSLNRFTGGVTAPAGHTLRVFQRQPDGSIRTLVQLSIPDAPAR